MIADPASRIAGAYRDDESRRYAKMFPCAGGEDDLDWRSACVLFGWRLPAPAAWPWRLWGVRYLRAACASIGVDLWYAYGPGSIGVRSGYDDWVLYAVRRGWC